MQRGPISSPGFAEVSFNPQARPGELCFSFRLLGRVRRDFPLFTLQPPAPNGNCSYVAAVPDDIAARFCLIACMRDGDMPSYGLAIVDDPLELEGRLKAFGVSRGAIESWNRHHPKAQLPLETAENLLVCESALQRIMRGPG